MNGHRLHPADPYYSGKLLLPSFGIEVDGIEVTRSAPRTEVFLAGEGIDDLICDSGDAFSISYLYRQSDATIVDRRFMGLDPAYIRRVLLRVLDGEEYDDILLHYNLHHSWEVKPGVPKGKPLDLRDVRERRSGSEGAGTHNRPATRQRSYVRISPRGW